MAEEAFLQWQPPEEPLPVITRLDEAERVEALYDYLEDEACAALRYLQRHGLRPLVAGWHVAQTQQPPVTPAIVAHAQLFSATCWRWVLQTYRTQTLQLPSLVLQPMPRNVLALAWYLFTQAALLHRLLEGALADDGSYDPRPLAVLTPATEGFETVRLLAERGRLDMDLNSTLPLWQYTTTDWTTATHLALRARCDVTGWTPSASAYLRALVLRYAMLLRGPPNEPASSYKGSGSANGGTELERQLVPPGMSPALVRQPALQLVPILRRNAAAAAWYAAATEILLDGPERALRAGRVTAWAAFATAVARDPVTRESVTNTLSVRLLRRLLDPGEVVRLGWEDEEPLRNVEPDQVLYRLRRRTYAAAMDLMRASPIELIDQWSTAAAAAAAEGGSWEQAAAARPANEQVALLVLETALDTWSELQGRAGFFSRQAYVDNASLLPPYDAPPADPREALQPPPAGFGREAPIFVAIDKLYAVVLPDEATARVIVTPYLVEALTIWLRAATAHHPRLVHPALAPVMN